MIQACAVENITAEGVCTVPVWVEKPTQAFPPLTLAEGTQVAFSIVACWTVGLCFKLYVKSARGY